MSPNLRQTSTGRLPAADLAIRADESSAVHVGPWKLFTGSRPDLGTEFERLIVSDRPHLVVTPNVDHVLRLQESADFRVLYDMASLRLIDGAPISALASVSARRRVPRIAGSDLLEGIGSILIRPHARIAIVGGPSADEAVAVLSAKEPHHTFLSVDFPMVDSVSDSRLEAAASELAQMKPDVVFVCIGSPKQELWFAQWRDRLPGAVYIGAGASADFSSGRKRRAPQIFQRLGIEWIWRLVAEPRRMAHRYLVKGPRFISVAFHSLRFAVRRRALG